MHNTGIHHSNDDFQHCCYLQNKSHNWQQCEFQNEKYLTCKQNVLEHSLDVTLLNISKWHSQIYMIHKYEHYPKIIHKILLFYHDRIEIWATYYWFSQLFAWAIFVLSQKGGKLKWRVLAGAGQQLCAGRCPSGLSFRTLPVKRLYIYITSNKFVTIQIMFSYFSESRYLESCCDL